MKEKSINILKNKLRDYTRKSVLIALVLFVFSLTGNIVRLNRSSDRISKAQNDIELLEKENEVLKGKLEFVESEFYAQKQLRDNLGLAREGEIVVIMPDDDVLRKVAPKMPEEKEKLPDPNWKKWMDLFM